MTKPPQQFTVGALSEYQDIVFDIFNQWKAEKNDGKTPFLLALANDRAALEKYSVKTRLLTGLRHLVNETLRCDRYQFSKERFNLRISIIQYD